MKAQSNTHITFSMAKEDWFVVFWIYSIKKWYQSLKDSIPSILLSYSVG